MKDLFNDNSYKLNTMLDSVEKLEVKGKIVYIIFRHIR